jgi:hypothetical protein
MPGCPGVPVVTNSCGYFFPTRGCGCIGHPAFPTPSLFGADVFGGLGRVRAAGSRRCVLSSLRGAQRRSNPLFLCCCMDCFASLAMTVSRQPACTLSRHRPRRRAIQYSRDASDRIERPRRTGYPAGACHRARRRRDPVAGYDDHWWRCIHLSRGQLLDCFAEPVIGRAFARPVGSQGRPV